jgi:hypothetical protein
VAPNLLGGFCPSQRICAPDRAGARVRRSGQLKLVTVYHVFAENTIDATITAACLRKTRVIAMLKGRPAAREQREKFLVAIGR